MTATSLPHTASADTAAARDYEHAERVLLEEYGIAAHSRRLPLADPALTARVMETGAGEPILMLHGSGMSAPTWAPMLAHLKDRRIHAFDLPGIFALRVPSGVYRATAIAAGGPGSTLAPPTPRETSRTSRSR